MPGLLATDSAHLHTELGLLHLNQGDVDSASEQFEQATSRFDLGQVPPESLPRSDLGLGLGRVHLLAGRPADARRCFTVAEQTWAGANAGSVWHADAQRGLALSSS